MDKKNNLREELLSVLREIKTVDCHSHTWLRRAYYDSGGFDLFTLISYFERDIESTAGGKPIYENAKNDKERWVQLKAVLQKSRNVSYWRHNLVVYRKLFGLKDEELTDDNCKEPGVRLH